MTEEVNEEKEEGALQPADAEQVQDDVSTNAEEDSQQKRNEEDKNWAEVRRKMREQQQLIQESQQQIAELTASNAPKEEENWGIEDEDLAEGKHIKELKKELKALHVEMKTRERESVNDRIHARYSDYEEVVTPENIEILKQKKPFLAKALSKSDNQYELAAEAYELIKTYVVTESPQPVPEALRALDNSNKPRSVQAVSKTSALADLNQFAELDAKGKKAFLRSKREEMEKAIKAG